MSVLTQFSGKESPCIKPLKESPQLAGCTLVGDRRGSQVVRPGSAKAPCVGSIPTRASNFKNKEGRPQDALLYRCTLFIVPFY